MKRLSPQAKIGGAIALLLLLGILSWFAPTQHAAQRSGSTYLASPDGYGAWYAYMGTQHPTVTVQRWRRPLTELFSQYPETGQTLLRIYGNPQRRRLGVDEEGLVTWLEAGNRLIEIGGLPAPVTAAPFASQVPSPYGLIDIETRRRSQPQAERILLADEHGAIAWSYSQGQGEVIHIVPPYLAANAYQAAAGNFAFLAAIAQQAPVPEGAQSVQLTPPTLWIDEHLHGYVDRATNSTTTTEPQSVWAYLLRTPLAIVTLQVAIVTLITLLALNRRFGLAIPYSGEPPPNNSQAYIEALAAVLDKAGHHRFVVKLLAPEYQRQLQRHLDLGATLLSEDELLRAWIAQTGKPPRLLRQVLQQARRDRGWGKAALLQWLQAWQQILEFKR